MHHLPIHPGLLELLDGHIVLSRAEWDLQACAERRKQPVQGREWWFDGVLHARRDLQHIAELERHCFQAGMLPYCRLRAP
jgi:hypothetical protein